MARLTEAEARKLGLGIPRRSRKASAKQMSREAFLAMCKAHGLPEPVSEFAFHPLRRWRFDWAWPGVWIGFRKRVALEIQGGLFSGGRHTQGAALLKEYEKLNEAQIKGWVVLLVSPKQVESGEAFALVKRALEA